MGGPGSGRRRGPPKASPHTAAWRETRQQVLRLTGDTCWICQHPGAGDVDHLNPVLNGDPTAYLDTANLAVAHGTKSPCPFGCGACNQRKGSSPVARANSKHRHDQHHGADSKPPPPTLTAAEIEARFQWIGQDHGHHPRCDCRTLIKAGLTRSRCW